MPKAVINSSSVANVRKQFAQDSLLVFEGHVYATDLNSIAYAKKGMPIDKDGFPTPVAGSEMDKLVFKMEEQYAKARRSYIQRLSDLELKSMTKQKTTEDEFAE